MKVCCTRIASPRLSHEPTISRASPCRVAVVEPAGCTCMGTHATSSTFPRFAVEPEGAVAAVALERRLRLVLADAA